ncbi:39S ribosomal protein L45, mitochondrial [Protopterus annectens]|uniref:39S ribosomal protein L45, mitochondrial n=1 Tax=Protopterus annectens TaxID=7888 RepID=UPI001CF9AF8B|nr:39S ribosomal protein L45, mitochondrial [Protopterus annectens]
MAASSSRAVLVWQHGRVSGVNLLLSLLSPSRIFLPCFSQVRTKRRHFIPPAVDKKQTTIFDQEAKARAAGLVVSQQYAERTINIACTAGIFDAYVPPEGDARMSSLSKQGLKQRAEQVKQTAASQLAIRKIKDYDKDFTTKAFPEKAQEIFIEAHNSLANFNKEKLHSLVTERCYPEMVRGNRYKTIHWKFVESLEPTRVVHARSSDMVNKGNIYGQVTVRMHSKQVLAIYDRFGRLMVGSEEIPKDVLEYVVFERHLTNPYGQWRMHGKIVPAWAPPKDPIIKTILIPGPDLKPWEEFAEMNYEVPTSKQVQWYK